MSTNGGGEEMEDADDDVEYNYLADQEVVEKEEFRNDRAVKISSKKTVSMRFLYVLSMWM